MSSEECIFCGMAAGTVDTEVLFRDEELFVVRDIYPKAPIHLLIIPLVHVASLRTDGGDTPETLGRMFGVAEEMARWEGVEESGYRLVVNQGTDAGQAIEHLHMHLLGGKALGDLG